MCVCIKYIYIYIHRSIYINVETALSSPPLLLLASSSLTNTKKATLLKRKEKKRKEKKRKEKRKDDEAELQWKCRVLRKGCSDSCSIRPCLEWIKSPDAQSNATVFLAKLYGRAGLLNLINASGPAVFRSLLYEACGRIVNPMYGSVGLLLSGKWHMCQAAVEAVLKGEPIVRISDDEAAATAATTCCCCCHNNNKKKRKSSSASATTCKNKVHQQQADSSAVVSLDSDDAEAGSHVVSQAEHNGQEEIQEQEQQQLGLLDLTLGFGFAPTAGERDTGAAELADFVGFRFL